VARGPEQGAATQYDVVMPGREHHAIVATEAELAGEYTGIAIVATPRVEATPGARVPMRP
jgi:hypothetical protein